MKDQGDWLKQMGDLQQQYWNGWRDLAGQAVGQPPPSAPWQDGMDVWARALGMKPAQPSNPFFAFAASAMPQPDPVERLLDQGKRYLGLLQGMMAGDAFKSAQEGFDPRAWLEQMRGAHERFGQDLLGKVQSVPWFGGIDVAQIEQLVKAFTGTPVTGVKQELQSWLQVPAFGLNREHQERTQALASAWLDYQDAQRRYDELMLSSARRTFDLLESKLAEREAPGRQIETARALYDLWIDAAEDAFAEVAMSADYRSVYGELVNTQMRVRSGINGEIERIGASFGLPTRTEVDTLARQVHELKRELRRRDAKAPSARPVAAAAPAPAPAPKASTKTSTAARASAEPASAPTRAARKPRAAGKAQLVAAAPASVSKRAGKSAAKSARRPSGKSGKTAKVDSAGRGTDAARASGNVSPIIQSTRGTSGKRG